LVLQFAALHYPQDEQSPLLALVIACKGQTTAEPDSDYVGRQRSAATAKPK
jgi:hypothetical protein